MSCWSVRTSVTTEDYSWSLLHQTKANMDPCFQHRGFEQRGRRRRPPCRGVRGHPPPENFEISSPWKRDFRHSEAKSACFNISFFKVKMPFFLHQNITKLSRNDANLHLWIYHQNILHFIFFQFCVSSTTGSIRSILWGYPSAKSWTTAL